MTAARVVDTEQVVYLVECFDQLERWRQVGGFTDFREAYAEAEMLTAHGGLNHRVILVLVEYEEH